MDGDTTTLLKDGIHALCGFFNAPPPELLSLHGLDKASVDLLFGPDIESYFMNNGRNLLQHARDMNDIARDPDFMTHHPVLVGACRQFSDAALHWNGGIPTIEGNTLEVRLTPSGPKKICDLYNEASRRLNVIAQDNGADVFAGHGHWHVSLNQNGQNIFNDNAYMRRRYNIYRATGDSILKFQKTFPAFFVKPYIADCLMPTSYSGPRSFSVTTGNQASLRFNDKRLTWEPRLAVHAPYQPVYLTMAALRHAFTDDGPWPKPVARPANGEEIRRGRGGYLDMIVETLNGMKATDAIPADIARALLHGSIRDYRSCLNDPLNAGQYDGDIRADILRRLDAIEARLDPQAARPPAQKGAIFSTPA